MVKLKKKNQVPFNRDMMALLELSASWRRPCAVLDGGCGKAETSRWLARRGCDVTGVDIKLPYPSKEFIKINGVEPGTLRLIKDDLSSMTFDMKFHVVALFGVLHYAGSPSKVEALLRQLDEWLSIDGLAVLTWITDDIPHTNPGVYLPCKSSVVGIMRGIGYRSLQFWEKFVEHTHGGDSHRHCIAYSAWIKQSTAGLVP
jgi:SAM-dependent methyltransferase